LYAHLQCFTLDAVWLINEHIRATTNGDSPRSLVDRYGFKDIGIVDVDRLEECLRTAEDDQRVAGDVCLLSARARVSDKELWTSDGAVGPSYEYLGIPTTTRRSSQNVVVND
jgi:hypothetical protein